MSAKVYRGMVLLTDEVQNDATQYNQFVTDLGGELSKTVMEATAINDGSYRRNAAVEVLIHALATIVAPTNGIENHAEYEAFVGRVTQRFNEEIDSAKTYGHLSIDFDSADLVYDSQMGWTVSGDLLKVS